MSTAVSHPSSTDIPNQNSDLSAWLNYMQQIHVSAIDMGLSRVIPVADALGLIDSAKKEAYVFTVAGTNGKGSTTAMISEICQQAGYKTALYQSPHLLEFNERVRINGVPVTDAVLIAAFVKVEAARQRCELTLSFFEMTTLAAMLIFAEAACDVWVLEVGLGGRLDVVNIIDPDLAVITNIAIDHVDWLGDTRDKIGYEKAGILREGIPLIYGDVDMPVTVQEKIDAMQVICFQQGVDFDDVESKILIDTETNKWQFSSAAVTLQLPKPNLSLVNTANAVAAVLASSLTVSVDAISAAMDQVILAGRFDRRDLAGRHWLFDVAHNKQGVQFLLSQFVPLWQSHRQVYPDAKLHIVFSMLGDKDIEAVVWQLTQAQLPIDGWYIAEIDYPRAAHVDELQAILSEYRSHSHCDYGIHAYDTLAAATKQVIQTSLPDDLILVAGSFHTIGEVLKTLGPSV